MGNASLETKHDSEKFSYLDLLASLGSAKHIGGRDATEKLIEAAGITPGSKVLDVGCGMGKTSCKLASMDCQVTGVDIMPRMIKESKARAWQTGVKDKTTFLECDARSLPFEPETFDAVIVESVTVFMDDVERAIEGYRRVVKPGGRVCDNEVCITRETMEKMGDRLDDLKSVFAAFGSMTSMGMLTFEDWKEIFEKQFSSVQAGHHLMDLNAEMETRREDGFKTFAAAIKSMWLYMTNPEAKRIIEEGNKMGQFMGEFGYGLFVCRK